MCFFWNGSYTTAHYFFIFHFFLLRTGFPLDKSFLFRFSILSGPYLPGKKCDFGHLSGKPVLMEGGAIICHVTSKSGRGIVISAFFKYLKFETERLLFAGDTAHFVNCC